VEHQEGRAEHPVLVICQGTVKDTETNPMDVPFEQKNNMEHHQVHSNRAACILLPQSKSQFDYF